MKPLNEWLGYWNADFSTSSASVPNLGSGGIGSATNNSNGLVKVTGPAIWVPKVALNSIVTDVQASDPTTSWQMVFCQTWNGLPDAFSTLGGFLGGTFQGHRFHATTSAGLLRIGATYGDGTAFFSSTALDLNISSLVVGKKYWWRLTAAPGTGFTVERSETKSSSPPNDFVTVGSQAYPPGGAVATSTSFIRFTTNGGSGEQWHNSIWHYLSYKFGNKFVEIKEEDIPSDPAATSFVCSTGQTITISRGSSGPCTVIVPKGKTVFINPDNTNNNNYLWIPDHAEWDMNHTWGHFTFNGNASNNLSVPDDAALDIVGDIEFVNKIEFSAYAGVNQGLQLKWDGTSQRSYGFLINNSGALRAVTSPDGGVGAVINRLSTVTLASVGITDGQKIWVKATIDVDDGASQNVVKFYYALDQEEEPTSWTQLGADVVNAGATSIFNGTRPVVIGSLSVLGGLTTTGNIYRSILRNGIGGTTVLDIGRHDIPAGGSSFTCKTGQTVTINGTVPITPRSGEDGIMFFVGQLGNPTGGTTWPMNLSGGSTGLFALRRESTGGVAGQILTVPPSGSTTTTHYNPGDDNKCVHIYYVRRSDNLLVRRTYAPNLSVTEHTTSSVAAGVQLPSNGLRFLINSPSVFYSAGYDKGMGVIPTNAELDELAASLLSSSMAEGDYLDFSHDFDPDFSQKDLYLQPNTQRSRSYYRSPLASQELNLQHNSIFRDISYLYERFEELGIDIEDEIQDIYEDGIEGIEFDETIKGINGLLLDVKNLRKQIEELKKPL